MIFYKNICQINCVSNRKFFNTNVWWRWRQLYGVHECIKNISLHTQMAIGFPNLPKYFSLSTFRKKAEFSSKILVFFYFRKEIEILEELRLRND
jgi:hypothetical protein